MKKICGIYRITNTVTGDFYIGSSKNVKHRLANHKCPSRWNDNQNNPLYQDMKNYGLDKFDFQILAEVEVDKLKETEQWFIETLKPTYNNHRAKGFDIERYKKSQKKYLKSDKCKLRQNKYQNQLCCYNGETLTLNALSKRFIRAGIPHPTQEAKKYLI